MSIRGIHGEKIVAALNSDKLPESDRQRVEEALKVYDQWIKDISLLEEEDKDCLVCSMVDLLNKYKYYVDVNLIFDSPNDFLYRQKGQLKLDNTVMEEFLPILVKKYFSSELESLAVKVGSQTQTCSFIYFNSSISTPQTGGGISCKCKDQDFSISRELFIKSSFKSDFQENETASISTHIGYVQAELKTNLDKTMFQEATGTAQDIKRLLPGAKYYLLCDFLDMTPISSGTTCIDEILITRKCKRISSQVRKEYSTAAGRVRNRNAYTSFLANNPYSPEVFHRFLKHIEPLFSSFSIDEHATLERGFF